MMEERTALTKRKPLKGIDGGMVRRSVGSPRGMENKRRKTEAHYRVEGEGGKCWSMYVHATSSKNFLEAS
jgi:hypothetical protein